MSEFQLPVSLKQRIGSKEAFHYRIVPKAGSNGHVVLLTDSADLTSLETELKVVLEFPFTLEVSSKELINSFLSANYRESIGGRALTLGDQDFLEQLLTSAQEFGSSDIHIEPYESFGRIRFRLDGNLKTQYEVPLTKYPELVNQIKIKADLDISQKRISQDGRISINEGNKNYDLRVSTMPTLYGEKVVLRILQRNSEAADLKDLGFSREELATYLEAIKDPNGIILISGPTGSGKTTTLYGTLKKLNEERSNIVTIEDPIEYTLEGINQVQLKEDIGFDFPKALRTFLRQDPDIIMVGEIRDEKTANMAIKAALTGHLVLSTIHTNSAWATISRLIDMGVPSYLLAGTLSLSVAQRLVRKLCPKCKQPHSVTSKDVPREFDLNTITASYKAVGCEHCYYTGYKGRIAVYEVLPIDEELELSIRDNQLQIDEYLERKEIKTLKSNALRLVNAGVTSIDEVYALLKSHQ
ncbi:GspE/PulE family protein [Gilvibacter sediminis]|uniref:GspE/PulE family protein n=1 Tax=Gilvibacter sediminis TaxID=379071 RepID=UPI0023510328|nr:GspE/PulE family protein [Gilvibacter sediminis]MDC7996884.1 GspE/PulE family protein [Gilvibacter sediminis]